MSYFPMGADDPTPSPPTLRDAIDSEPVSMAAGVAMTYHGYKRTGSIFWALVYGAIGKFSPLIATPIALAQGFGKKKEGCP